MLDVADDSKPISSSRLKASIGYDRIAPVVMGIGPLTGAWPKDAYVSGASNDKRVAGTLNMRAT
jgi:hypothetical protein